MNENKSIEKLKKCLSKECLQDNINHCKNFKEITGVHGSYMVVIGWYVKILDLLSF